MWFDFRPSRASGLDDLPLASRRGPALGTVVTLGCGVMVLLAACPPLFLILLVGSALYAVTLIVIEVVRPKRPRGACAVCGYDLRAAPDRCPECGTIPEDSGGTSN